MEEQGKRQEIEIEEVTAQENVIAVRDLVPMRAAMDDSMERIADMKDQFSQTIDPILRMYNAAMCATTARLEIIEDEFKYRKLRCPIHHIDTRLKSAKSILGKLQKKDLDLTLSAACNNIYDIAGIRVVCSYIKDVYLIRDRLMAQDDVMIIQIKDYIETPKENGYRSLHMVIRVPVYFMNKSSWCRWNCRSARWRWICGQAWSMTSSISVCIRRRRRISQRNLKECSRLIYEAEEKNGDHEPYTGSIAGGAGDERETESGRKRMGSGCQGGGALSAPCHAGADGGLAGEDHALCATEAGDDSARRILQSV